MFFSISFPGLLFAKVGVEGLLHQGKRCRPADHRATWRSGGRVLTFDEEMAQLKDKVQNSLDENRLLVLGCQVLLGLQFRAAFESRFQSLSRNLQVLNLVALWLLVLALALLVTPSAYHRIVEKGQSTPMFLAFSSRLMWPVLLPVALALSFDVLIAAHKILGSGWGWILALGVFTFSMTILYGLEWVQRERRDPVISKKEAMSARCDSQSSSLSDKIRQVLTEARLVLPGAQALLGFQFVIILTEAFDQLPDFSKRLHLASLICVGCTVVLLLAPAAYHRIVERGENTNHMHKFASAMVLWATIPLALGIAGDLYVVTLKILGSLPLAILTSAVALVLTYGLWFGLTFWVRWRRRLAEVL